MYSTPMSRYVASLESGLLTPDRHQVQAVAILEQCFQQLITEERADSKDGELSLLQKIQRGITGFFARENNEIQKQKQKGCYIWGGVGRGKTHLMDYFYESLPETVSAKRTHFHRFMKEVHQRMHQLGGAAEPLSIIGREYSQKYSVLCLDEFVVIDITDAMLLAGLTSAFFQNGLMLITTSNVPPAGLYKDGLQRARFLPTIDNLEKNLEIFHLDSSQDYRLRHLKQNPTFLVQNIAESQEAVMESIYMDQASGHKAEAGEIEVNNRLIRFKGKHNDLIWFDFFSICGDRRSVSDYIDIAKEFHTVFVSNVPQFDQRLESEARRFVHLVDELYDTRVKLVATAAVPIHELYKGTQVVFEFQRTESRLIEMQSEDYLASASLTDKKSR